MDNKNKATIIASLALMAAIGAGTIGMGITADAYQNNSNGQKRGCASSGEQRCQMQERRGQMEEVMGNNDYEAWKSIVDSKCGASDVITEENFSKFAEMHKLMGEGKGGEARVIREELGVPGMGGKMGRGSWGMGIERSDKGKNFHGNFKDENNDGICDNMQ